MFIFLIKSEICQSCMQLSIYFPAVWNLKSEYWIASYEMKDIINYSVNRVLYWVFREKWQEQDDLKVVFYLWIDLRHSVFNLYDSWNNKHKIFLVLGFPKWGVPVLLSILPFRSEFQRSKTTFKSSCYCHDLWDTL